MSDLTAEVMRDLLREQASTLSGAISGFGKNINPMTGGGSTSGGSVMSEGLSSTKSVLSNAASLISNGVTGISSAINQNLEPWQNAGKIGISFNNDAIGYRTAIAQTRMGTEQFGQAISRTSTGFTALGGTMSDSAKVFAAASTDFSNTNAADQLRNMGYTTAEYNEVLALSMQGRRKFDINDAQSRTQAFQATSDLAQEMDKVAKLTGVSRKEQMDALEKSKTNARVRLAIEDAVAAGGEKQRDAYNEMNAQMTGLGLNEFTDVLYSGQAKTKEAIEIQNALGPAGTQLEAAVKATKNATTEGERAAAKKMLADAQAAVAARTTEESFRNLVKTGLGPVSDAAGQIANKTLNYAEGLKKQQADMAAIQEEGKKNGKIINEAEAAEILAKRVKQEQESKNIKGEDVAGAKTTQLMTQAANRIADQEAGIYRELGRLNDFVGAQAIVKTGIEATANVKTDEKTGEITSQLDRSIATQVGDAIRLGFSDPEKFSAVAKAKVGEMAVDVIKIGTAAVDYLKSGPSTGTEEAEKIRGPFANGTKDVLGSWFGDFKPREKVMVDPNEAIVPFNKMGEFINDMMPPTESPEPTDIISKLFGSLNLTDQMTPEPSVDGGLTKHMSGIADTLKVNSSVMVPPPPPPQSPRNDQELAPKEAPIDEFPKAKMTMDDLNDQLEKLNKQMSQLISNTTETMHMTSKQVRATKQLSPNMNTR